MIRVYVNCFYTIRRKPFGSLYTVGVQMVHGTNKSVSDPLWTCQYAGVIPKAIISYLGQ